MKRRPSQKNPNTRAGFILPLVVILGLILAVGGFTMLARSFAGLFGASRQEQARQAREIAETGLATSIELLNRKYSYLLINCYSRSGSPPMAGRSAIWPSRGHWSLVWSSPSSARRHIAISHIGIFSLCHSC